MPSREKRLDPERQAEFIAEVRRDQALRQKTYREQALKIYPHVCGRCGREFSGKRLRELTVHHKDNDHMNNPPNGSNWELLCLYCHDAEHQKYLNSDYRDSSAAYGDQEPSLGFRPFEGLGVLLKPDEDDESNSNNQED